MYYKKISLLPLIFSFSNQIPIHPTLLQTPTTFLESPKRFRNQVLFAKRAFVKQRRSCRRGTEPWIFARRRQRICQEITRVVVRKSCKGTWYPVLEIIRSRDFQSVRLKLFSIYRVYTFPSLSPPSSEHSYELLHKYTQAE